MSKFTEIATASVPELGVAGTVEKAYAYVTARGSRTVAKVRFPKEVRSHYQPAVQWLVWFDDQSMFPGFGKTRYDAVLGAEEYLARKGS